MPTTKHYTHCWTSTFQPKKLWSGVALCFHDFTTAAEKRKLSQDDSNGDTTSRISRTTIVYGASSSNVNGPFSSWSTHLSDQGLFESPQPLPHYRPLTAGMFHRFLVSRARRSRKCCVLYVIFQTNSVNSTRYTNVVGQGVVRSARTSHHSHGYRSHHSHCYRGYRIVHTRLLSRHTQSRDRPSSTREAFLRPDRHNVIPTNF